MSELPITVAAWPKNGRETLQVRLDTLKNHAVVDCRSWYAGSDGTLKPGRGGMTLSIRHLSQIVDALDKTLAKAPAAGRIPPGGPAIE